MAKNPYNGGVAPERIYASGTAFNSAPPNAIAVWHTDNGGLSWSQPTVGAINNNAAYLSRQNRGDGIMVFRHLGVCLCGV